MPYKATLKVVGIKTVTLMKYTYDTAEEAIPAIIKRSLTKEEQSSMSSISKTGRFTYKYRGITYKAKIDIKEVEQ